MTGRLSLGLTLLLAALFVHTLATTSAHAQEVVELRRDQLASQPNTDEAGRVTWSLTSSGTRTQNVRCTLETEFVNNTVEIAFRLFDGGGLSGDPACDMNLRFAGLQNSFTFASVAVSNIVCGNGPCPSAVLVGGVDGTSTFNVRVRGGMRGVTPLATRPQNIASFRVRLRLRGPAVLNPLLPQPLPDLIVARLTAGWSLKEMACTVGVRLINLGDPGWASAQPNAYDQGGGRAVRVTLTKGGQQCGSQEVLLRAFDPNRLLDQTLNPVTLTWPGCTLSLYETADLTATADDGNRLFELSETGKTRSQTLTCELFRRQPLPVLRPPVRRRRRG